MIVSARALLYRYFHPLLLSFVLILLANLYTIVYLNGVYRFFGVPSLMLLTVLVVLVQQKEAIDGLRKLNKQSTKGQRSDSYYQLKTQYSEAHQSAVHLSGNVAAYSRQWAAYLSAEVPANVAGTAYLTFVLILFQMTSKSRLPHLFTAMFALTDAAVIWTLFFQLNFCAQVVRFSGRYEREVEHFLKRVSKILSPIELLKSDVEVHRRVAVAFRFVDGSTINPGTFPMIVSYCAIFLLMIAKRSSKI
ncbi:hypothetical protein TYRP_015141 [Tyrophagus putrescentiae]|nr:hypothetical protein TYRP_015141 [Tyrophagus putrescentiae]